MDTLKLGVTEGSSSETILLFQSLTNQIWDFSVFFVLWYCNNVIRVIHLLLLHLLVQFKLKPET